MYIINGINLRRFNSSPSHRNSQFVLEIARIDLITITTEDIIIKGELVNIKV